jgi:sugar-specific transcriptional regulator TrmB
MTVEDLKKIGLTEYEAKSYLALVKYGAMQGREIAKKSEVPPTRVFDTLKSLIDKGFVFQISQKPMAFQAVKTEVAVNGLIERRIENLKHLEKSIKESVEKLKKPATEEKIEEKISVVSGFEKMFSLVNRNTNNAKKELLVFSVGEKIPYSTEIALRKAVKRGLKFRFIASRCDKENIPYLKKLKSFGATVRYYRSENYSISIYDRKIVHIVVKSPSNPKERIMTIFDNKDLAKAMFQWFEMMWNKARSINF